jgi:hypothetical protein
MPSDRARRPYGVACTVSQRQRREGSHSSTSWIEPGPISHRAVRSGGDTPLILNSYASGRRSHAVERGRRAFSAKRHPILASTSESGRDRQQRATPPHSAMPADGSSTSMSSGDTLDDALLRLPGRVLRKPDNQPLAGSDLHRRVKRIEDMLGISESEFLSEGWSRGGRAV